MTTLEVAILVVAVLVLVTFVWSMRSARDMSRYHAPSATHVDENVSAIEFSMSLSLISATTSRARLVAGEVPWRGLMVRTPATMAAETSTWRGVMSARCV